MNDWDGDLERTRRIWRALRELGMAVTVNEYCTTAGLWIAEFLLSIPDADRYVQFDFRDGRWWATGTNTEPTSPVDNVLDRMNYFFWAVRRERGVGSITARAWLRIDEGGHQFSPVLSACVELRNKLGQHGAIYRDKITVQLAIDAMGSPDVCGALLDYLLDHDPRV